MLTFVSRVSLPFLRAMMPLVASMLQSPMNSLSLSNFKRLWRHNLVYSSCNFPRLTSFLAFPLVMRISAHITSFCCKGMVFRAAELPAVGLYTSDMTLARRWLVSYRGDRWGDLIPLLPEIESYDLIKYSLA